MILPPPPKKKTKKKYSRNHDFQTQNKTFAPPHYLKSRVPPGGTGGRCPVEKEAGGVLEAGVEESAIGENYTTLCNILKLKKCK